MGLKVANSAFGTLAASISDTDTTIAMQGGDGDRFPVLGGGDYFYATLIDVSNNLEVVKVTARSTDTLVVERGQDGTTAKPYNANDRIEMRLTASIIDEILSRLEALET